VYLDTGLPYPNDIEMTNGAVVQVSTSDGSTYTKTVTDGQVVFDMSANAVGTDVLIQIQGLYRSYTLRLTEQGEIMVPFRLKQPLLPPVLP
jgi:uncharacterized protein YcfJ